MSEETSGSCKGVVVEVQRYALGEFDPSCCSDGLTMTMVR